MIPTLLNGSAEELETAVREDNIEQVCCLLERLPKIAVEASHIGCARTSKMALLLLKQEVAQACLTGSCRSAIQKGWLDVIRFLFEVKGFKLPLIRNRRSPMFDVVRYGQCDILKYLAARDLNAPKCTMLGNYTLLHEAANYGNLQIVKLLIEEYDAPIDALYTRSFGSRSSSPGVGRTALHNAVNNGHMHVVSYLVSLGARTDVSDQTGCTPYELAIKKNNSEIAAFFRNSPYAFRLHTTSLSDARQQQGVVEEGDLQRHEEPSSDPVVTASCRSFEQMRPSSGWQKRLENAVTLHNLEAVRGILRPVESPKIPSSCVILAKSLDMIRLLTRYEVAPKDLDELCRSAIKKGWLDVITFLIEAKYVKISKRKTWKSFAHYAAEFAQCPIMRYLVSQDNGIATRPMRANYTPLHMAAKHGNIEMVRLLVEECQVPIDPVFTGGGGGSGTAPVGSGRTPLHSAVAKGHVEVVRYLVDHGARTDLIDRFGLTPYMLAQKKKKHEIVRCLEKYSKSTSSSQGTLQSPAIVIAQHENRHETSGATEVLVPHGADHILTEMLSIPLEEMDLSWLEDIDTGPEARLSLKRDRESPHVSNSSTKRQKSEKDSPVPHSIVDESPDDEIAAFFVD